MKSPRQCCMSPKRRDCFQPRDASPYPRGSTSSSPRTRVKQADKHTGRETWRRCDIALPAHLQTEEMPFLLCYTKPHPPQIQHVSVLVPQRRADPEEKAAGPTLEGVIRCRVTALPHLPGLNPHSKTLRIREQSINRWRVCHRGIWIHFYHFYVSALFMFR